MPSSRRPRSGNSAVAWRRNRFLHYQGGNMRNWIAGAAVALSLASTAHAAITEEPVTYQDGDTTMKGFVVYDDAVKGKPPGIVLVHDRRGLTNHMHNHAPPL